MDGSFRWIFSLSRLLLHRLCPRLVVFFSDRYLVIINRLRVGP